MSTCPGCGAEVSYTVQETRVLTGTCSDCHRVTTLVEGALPLGTPTPADGNAAPADDAPSPAAAGPECAECGEVLTITARDDGFLEVACTECETTTTFVPEGSVPSPGSRQPADRYDRPRRRDRPASEGAPAARPCRQCGAPLRFTTDDEGMLTGECTSCGNRFTLPPRREGGVGRAERGERDRFAPRGPPRYGRKPGSWSGRGSEGRPRYGSRSGAYRRRDASSGGASFDRDDRPRRRRRRE